MKISGFLETADKVLGTDIASLISRQEYNTSEGHLGGYVFGGDRRTYYPRLWDWMVDELGVRTVLDVGCAEGRSTAYFKGRGCRVLGIEGSGTAIADSPVASDIVRHDFVEGPYVPDRDYDMVWSCEFVEHVEEAHERNFLETFRRAGRYVFMTHALPGQPGWHHVNCQKPGYWIGRLAGIGFTYDHDLTMKARKVAGNGYFASTGLVFTRGMTEPLQKNTPLASVVVCTFNRRLMLLECLDSLLAQTYPRYEVVVVDDGSSDGTGEAVRGYLSGGRVRYLRQPHAGLSSARNHGIRNSEGAIICLIDDDCLADRDWLSELVRAYSRKDIGGVGGRIINHEPGSQPKTLTERFLETSGILRQKYVDTFIVGANSSYRREALDGVGGFDDAFHKAEDIDVCMRLRAAGWRLAYAPDAVAYHRARQGLLQLLRQFYGYGTGYAMLSRKYGREHGLPGHLTSRAGSVILNLLKTPLRIPGALGCDDAAAYLLEPPINAALTLMEIAGILREAARPTRP